MAVTVPEHAALSRLVKVLAELVTGSYIAAIAKQERLPAEGSSKGKRLAAALTEGWARIRARDGCMTKARFQQIIWTLTMEGHRRFTQAEVKMTHADVDAIVKAMRDLDLDPGDLPNKRWRKDLPATATDGPSPATASASAPAPVVSGPRPRPYPHLVAEIQAYSAPTSSVSPQIRGTRFEAIVHEVLEAEGLAPRGPVRNPGEELDRTFSIHPLNYLLECKWEQGPIESGPVRGFMDKVRRKAEGTFGVFLSMNGFVRGINASASEGQRLNCVGITGVQFIGILEGHTTWCRIVEAARRAASDRSIFFEER